MKMEYFIVWIIAMMNILNISKMKMINIVYLLVRSIGSNYIQIQTTSSALKVAQKIYLINRMFIKQNVLKSVQVIITLIQIIYVF